MEGIDRLFAKMDLLQGEMFGVKSELKVLSFRVDELIDRHANEDDEKSSVRKQVKAWLIISLTGIIGAAVVYDTKHGWTP